MLSPGEGGANGVSVLALERKSMPMVAWYMLSNESYIKRVMSDVLPTVDKVAVV